MKIAGVIKSSMIDYPGKASTVIFLGGCNFRCGYCHNPEMVHPQRQPDEKVSPVPQDGIDPVDLMAFLEKRKRFLDGVCISGGEPTLNKELPELIEQIKSLGLSVKLDTNGSNPDMLRDFLSKALVDYVAMDIKGPADKYQWIVRYPINMDTIKESATLLTDAFKRQNFPCEFRTTVCRELLSESDLKRMIAEYPDAPPWYLQRFINPGKILDSDGVYSPYTPEEMEQLGKKLCVSVR